MAKKNLLKAAGMALAAAGAIGLGTGTAPVGQEVLTAAQNTQVVQKAPQGKKARANQQQTQQQPAKRGTGGIERSTTSELRGLVKQAGKLR